MKREPFYEELGRRVARLRQERHLSQQGLADRMQPQMTRASVANIESGQQRVLAHTLVQLAHALGCDLDALVYDAEVASPETEAVKQELEEKLQDERVPKKTVAAIARSLGLQAKRGR